MQSRGGHEDLVVTWGVGTGAGGTDGGTDRVGTGRFGTGCVGTGCVEGVWTGAGRCVGAGVEPCGRRAAEEGGGAGVVRVACALPGRAERSARTSAASRRSSASCVAICPATPAAASCVGVTDGSEVGALDAGPGVAAEASAAVPGS